MIVCSVVLVYFCDFFFFFKQKTAYEMRISDWSSDVCSSDLITARDNDIGGYVNAAQAALNTQLKLPAGYSWAWAGHYQFMQRAERRMAVIIPITVISLFVLLFMGLRSVSEALMVMVAVPLSLVGGFWLLYLLDYQLSVAVGVGKGVVWGKGW